ncbi:MAG TPA: hypothetical protein VFI32_03775, partial [Rhodanobacteraceae bacterium]|nr:hypothetical protein [Rhodanobacteraceae bacterium]
MKPAADDHLRWLQTSGDSGVWESMGARACFTLDRQALGGPLEAGWYELRGRFEAENGGIILPSVRLRYIEQSPLTDLEILLPEPDASGCICRLLLFLDGVESLQFSPGDTVRFRTHGFRLRRVSRIGALCTLLGGTASALSMGSIRRLFAWGRVARRRGLKRATDELYADYQRRMGPRNVSEYAAWIRKYDTPGDAALGALDRRARMLVAGAPLISILLRVRDAQEPRLRRCL